MLSAPAPLVTPPSEGLLEHLGKLPSPALVYDLDNLQRSVEILKEDLARVEDAEVNLALKACHTPRVLSFLAGLGLGADVASVGELELAVGAGFRRITATGPSFSSDQLPLLDKHQVMVDATSMEQFNEICTSRPGEAVGLRLRVPLPKSLHNIATFGAGSRFGVLANDLRIQEVLDRTGCRLTRLHTHTGQMSPQHVIYKVRYLLAVAEAYKSIEEIDLGGGFFALYSDREQAQLAWDSVAVDLENFTRKTGRKIRILVEPGAAILSFHGYLVTTVRSAEYGHPFFQADVLTVDSSAWNFSPWHKPQFIPLSPRREGESLRPTLLAGDTLYEHDFFGADSLGHRHPLPLPEMNPGERIVITTSGAYTMTNSRNFNRLPLPQEYILKSGQIERI
ncbi:hypothetical protein OHA98_16720 [Streptomyces sp. NBC_00654]|uniref:diaminopimelate decarboxylase family protein n=1 Tax=Streptomyces sp. NBC_00654 TaxID=2975799 RepID=UPI00224E007B|nr:hypothetical protein [Streptomyces sp. NBC_00654]MCX4966448.1 hypothetical protein [Streptomyces sp. NBC_00654]